MYVETSRSVAYTRVPLHGTTPLCQPWTQRANPIEVNMCEAWIRRAEKLLLIWGSQGGECVDCGCNAVGSYC
jgi:hypothetical protein